MTDHTLTPIPLTPPRSHGTRYPESVKEAAFRAWAFDYGQNCALVAKRLNLEDQTVNRWKHDLGWVARLGDENRAEFPHHHASVRFSLLNAARDCAAWMWRVARGDAPPDKNRQLTCVACLDRAGFVPAKAREAHPDELRPAFANQHEELSAQELLDQARAERDALDFGPDR